MLSEDHEIYAMYGRSFSNVTLSNFLHQLKELTFCNGISVPDSSKELNCQKHVLPKKFDYNAYQIMEFKPCLFQDEYYHSNSCEVLVKPGIYSCSQCHLSTQKFITGKKQSSCLEATSQIKCTYKIYSP